MNKKEFKEGQIFGFPLISFTPPFDHTGYFGACRIVRFHNDGAVLATFDWVGEEMPALEAVSNQPLLRNRQGTCKGEPAIYWGAGKLPGGFQYIGISEPSTEEIELTTCRCKGSTCTCKRPYAGWKACRSNLYRGWRLKEDRAGFEAEMELLLQRLKRGRTKAKVKKEAKLERLTYDRFQEAVLFQSWAGYTKKELVEESRCIFQETTDKLMALGDSAEESDKTSSLKWCIERFNQLNQEHHFIDTLEREAICEEFDKLVHLAGLKDDHLADRWREW